MTSTRTAKHTAPKLLKYTYMYTSRNPAVRNRPILIQLEKLRNIELKEEKKKIIIERLAIMLPFVPLRVLIK